MTNTKVELNSWSEADRALQPIGIRCTETSRRRQAAAEAGINLLKVRLGQPRNRALMRAMEEPDLRRLVDQTGIGILQGSPKNRPFRPEGGTLLHFTSDNMKRTHRAGRHYLSPDDPDSFVLPDIASAFSEIDGNPDMPELDKVTLKGQIRENGSPGRADSHISQLLRAYCSTKRMSTMWLKTTES
ncbi:MAG: hypothetical protein R3F31_20305 [Verrucomicrobiales bacterium]